MTRDDIIRMAREAGLYGFRSPTDDAIQSAEHFAALVAAAEREACAEVVEGYDDENWSMLQQDDCAAAIRARSQQ